MMKLEYEQWQAERARVARGIKPRSSWWLVAVGACLVTLATALGLCSPLF